MFFCRFFCRHKWTIIIEKTTESQIEQSTRLFGNAPAPRTPSQFTEMTARKHIVIMTCDSCGKVKKIVTNV